MARNELTQLSIDKVIVTWSYCYSLSTKSSERGKSSEGTSAWQEAGSSAPRSVKTSFLIGLQSEMIKIFHLVLLQSFFFFFSVSLGVFFRLFCSIFKKKIRFMFICFCLFSFLVLKILSFDFRFWCAFSFVFCFVLSSFLHELLGFFFFFFRFRFLSLLFCLIFLFCHVLLFLIFSYYYSFLSFSFSFGTATLFLFPDLFILFIFRFLFRYPFSFLSLSFLFCYI